MFNPQPTISLAGRRLNRSPRWTGAAGINYAAAAGEGEVVFDAGIRFSSMYELTDLATFTYFYQPNYTKTDISVTYTAPNDAWYAGVYVENLEDNLVLTSAAAGQFDSASSADPRVIGVRIGASF